MSPRPRRNRRIQQPPVLKGFKPFGAPPAFGEAINLLFEEYEALRLADYSNLTQAEAAILMNVSRPTFSRIYDRARKKMATALVENKAVVIKGGNIEMSDEWYRCNDCNSLFGLPSAANGINKCPACGSGNIDHINRQVKENNVPQDIEMQNKPDSFFCVCPECGFKITHKKGLPCRSTICPNCGSGMKRESI